MFHRRGRPLHRPAGRAAARRHGHVGRAGGESLLQAAHAVQRDVGRCGPSPRRRERHHSLAARNAERARMSVRELFDLTDRVALITGGSRGLGLAMAHALGEMGAKLAITARKEAEVASALEELRSAGHAVFGAVSDLSKPETLEPMIAA